MLQHMDVSVVIPTFNERKNLDELTYKLHDSLERTGYIHEIIFVDDNSPDGTAQEIGKIAEKISCIKLVNRSNKMGVGSAVVEGVENSLGKIIITMDADLSHPPDSIAFLLANIEEWDIIVGSRYVKGGRMYSPLLRLLLSKFLNWTIRSILGLNIQDCTGGFMAVKREVFDSVGNIMGKYGNYAFELLYKAKRLGFKIKEVPFTYVWRERGNSKTNILQYGWTYIFSALNLPINGK